MYVCVLVCECGVSVRVLVLGCGYVRVLVFECGFVCVCLSVGMCVGV